MNPINEAPEPGPRHCDLLLENALVLTLDDEDRIFSDGAVAVLGDRICALGGMAQVTAQWTSPNRIDARGGIVMPGLVNVHNHTPLMITRGMVEDLGFAPMYTPGIPQGHWLDEEQTYLLSRLGVYEMLRAGSTTIVDFYRRPGACARAHAELGSRAVVAGRIHDADPAELARGRYVHDRAVGQATLDENAILIEVWHGSGEGRIRCDWAPHAPDTCSDDLLRQVGELALSGGGNVHTHLAQSRTEVEVVRARSNRSPVELLAELGLLNQRTIAGHCIWVEEADIRAFGRSGATVAHSPIGNAKSGMIAPVLALSEAGANIALCTDTMSGDMVEALRWSVSMQRILTGEMVLDARTALRMATRNGAVALGMQDEIGKLVEGTKADIVVFDPDSPMLAPVVDGYGVLAYSATGNAISTVIVDGRVVLRDGVLTTADALDVVGAAQQVANELWLRAGRAPLRAAGG